MTSGAGPAGQGPKGRSIGRAPPPLSGRRQYGLLTVPAAPPPGPGAAVTEAGPPPRSGPRRPPAAPQQGLQGTLVGTASPGGRQLKLRVQPAPHWTPSLPPSRPSLISVGDGWRWFMTQPRAVHSRTQGPSPSVRESESPAIVSCGGHTPSFAPSKALLSHRQAWRSAEGIQRRRHAGSAPGDVSVTGQSDSRDVM